MDILDDMGVSKLL